MASSNAPRLEEGLAHHQAGRLEDAEACYLDVVAAEPENAEAMKLIALVLAAQGEFEDAQSYATAATELNPNNGDYWHVLGRISLDAGDAEVAQTALEKALDKNPTEPLEVNVDLAASYAMRGSWEASLAIGAAQSQAYPNDVRALQIAATAAAALEKHDTALDYYVRAININDQDASLWVGAAKLYRAMGEKGKAWAFIERGLSLSPEDTDIHYMARILRSEAVPAWHFNMMNDAPRNAAFTKAFARQIKPHHVVLEIGTGAGLLAMMASRTGARVYTCEANPVLAAVARGIIETNGLADRITVIDKPSWDVEVGVDLPQPADVLVSEIFSAQLLSEDVIPTIEDAKARLLKPGGVVIPNTGSLVGVLVSNTEMAELVRVGKVEGFDVSAFNAFTPVLMDLNTPDYAKNWLSEPMRLFDFDFQNQDEFPSELSTVAVEATADGLAQGVVQWLELLLDDETVYANPPAGVNATRTKHWTPLFYPFAIPRDVKAGQTVMLRIGHDRKGVRIELAEIV